MSRAITREQRTAQHLSKPRVSRPRCNKREPRQSTVVSLGVEEMELIVQRPKWLEFVRQSTETTEKAHSDV